MRYGWAKVVEENEIRNIFVTHIDPMGKSGPAIVTEFRRVNNIFKWCGSIEQIAKLIAKILKVKSSDNSVNSKDLWMLKTEHWLLIMVNDFIGTGNAARTDIGRALATLDKECPGWESCCYPFYAVVSGFEKAAVEIEKRFNNRVKVIIAHPLEEKDRAFSPEAGIFEDDKEREFAKELFSKIGSERYLI